MLLRKLKPLIQAKILLTNKYSIFWDEDVWRRDGTLDDKLCNRWFSNFLVKGLALDFNGMDKKLVEYSCLENEIKISRQKRLIRNDVIALIYISTMFVILLLGVIINHNIISLVCSIITTAAVCYAVVSLRKNKKKLSVLKEAK